MLTKLRTGLGWPVEGQGHAGGQELNNFLLTGDVPRGWQLGGVAAGGANTGSTQRTKMRRYREFYQTPPLPVSPKCLTRRFCRLHFGWAARTTRSARLTITWPTLISMGAGGRREVSPNCPPEAASTRTRLRALSPALALSTCVRYRRLVFK